MRKATKGEQASEHLLEMIEEATEIRIRCLENIAGLLATSAHGPLLAVLSDPGVTRFLLPDELDLIRLFVKNARKEDCRLN